MRWIELDLNKIQEVEKQTDEVIRTFETLSRQLTQPRKPNISQIQQAVKVLKIAVASRIGALEVFYKENDLDSRAARFETCRLKLKKCLKEAGVTQQELSMLASQAPVSTTHNMTGNLGSPSSGPAKAPQANVFSDLPRNESGKVTLKVYMTTAEFEELRARRDAIRTVRKGQGSMAWENAAKTPRADPSREGMYTYHEVPVKDPLSSPRHEGPSMRFGVPPTPIPQAGIVNLGTKYQSTNPEVFARTARFPDAAAEWRGGVRAVDPSHPFNPNVSRTNTSNAVSKIMPVGSRVL